MKMKAKQNWAVIREGAKKGTTAYTGERDVPLTGGGQEQVVDQGLRGGPMVV